MRSYYKEKYRCNPEYRKKSLERSKKRQPESSGGYKENHLEKIHQQNFARKLFIRTRLRKIVLEENNYCCQICGKDIRTGHYAIHHIDKNNLNNTRSNLMLVCFNCHRFSLHHHGVPVALI
jgi:5-methylcytosine-specific restriction endonuclease McrA